jgi:ElaB/YqjD/DUF883 family membrane-anchored ribosome-binding protein
MDIPTTAPDKGQAVRDRLASSLQGIVNDAEDLLKATQRTGSEQFMAARDKFESRLNETRKELATLRDNTANNVRSAVRAADTAAHEHPYTTAGLAAGIGVLVGMLISRR